LRLREAPRGADGVADAGTDERKSRIDRIKPGEGSGQAWWYGRVVAGGGSMEFRILGPLEVRRGEQIVRLGAAKQRALLGVLILHANESVSTDRLVDALWGERPPATAEKLVQGYVHALRKQLGNGVLETSAPGYRLNVDERSLDLSEFERLADAARAAPLPEAVDLRRHALELWRGPALADVVLAGSDRHAIARISELRLATQTEQIDAELELGRHVDLVGELEALVAAHPYQERLAGQLMLALYRSGRQAEALETYRALRHRLDDELGLQPSQDLRDLETAILRQDGSLALPPPPPPETQPGDGVVREPPPDRMRRRRGTLLIGAAALSAVVAAAALALTRGDEAAFVAPPNSVVRIDASTNRVLGTIPVGVRPGPVAAGGDAIWVANLDDASLSRIDPASGTVVKNIPLPATPDAIAFGARAVWIVNGRLGTLYRVDPGFNGVTDALLLAARAVTFAGASVDVGGGSVWAAFGDATLARVDTFPLGEDGLATTGGGPSGVVFAFGSTWVTNSGDATVQRFGPLTFEEGDLGEFTIGRRPTGIAAGKGAMWVACTDDDYVARLDPSLSSESARTIPVGDGPTAVSVGEGAVWVVNTGEGTVSRIDPETNEVDETIAVGNAPASVAVADGTVWVTVQAP
jgi:YVTN family beta-propeller protein